MPHEANPGCEAVAARSLARFHASKLASLTNPGKWYGPLKARILAFRLKRLAKRLRNHLRPAADFAERTAPPMVSVALPVHRDHPGLETAIESILTQTFASFELLLILVSASDAVVIERYRTNPQVRVLTCKAGRTWYETALLVSRGHYVAFQDPAQPSNRTRLELCVTQMEVRFLDALHGPGPLEPSSPWASMVRIDAVRAVQGFKPETTPHEWTELWLRLRQAGCLVSTLAQPLITEAPGDPLRPPAPDLRHESCRIRPQRPRIAYLIPGKGISGGTAVVCQHLNRLQRRGYDVMLLDVLEDSKSLDWFPGQQVEVLPFSQRPRYLDVAVATGWQTVHYLQLLSAQRQFYFVQSDETRFTDDPELQRYIRDTYRQPFEFFTEARWIQRWLTDEFCQLAAYTPNGLDPAIIHPGEPLEPKGNRLRVLLEGPIDIPFKGMADAFAAVQDLDCEVWCVSSHGRPRPEWHCDRFFEAVPMTDMKRIYSSCDVLLKMSRVEGFFGPPMEMMACGGAAVVSKVTGYDEYIVDGENALVVDPGDVEAARHAIQRLLEKPELRQRLVENGARTAAAWRWEPTIDTLERLFTGAGALKGDSARHHAQHAGLDRP